MSLPEIPRIPVGESLRIVASGCRRRTTGARDWLTARCAAFAGRVLGMTRAGGIVVVVLGLTAGITLAEGDGLPTPVPFPAIPGAPAANADTPVWAPAKPDGPGW